MGSASLLPSWVGVLPESGPRWNLQPGLKPAAPSGLASMQARPLSRWRPSAGHITEHVCLWESTCLGHLATPGKLYVWPPDQDQSVVKEVIV